MTVRRWARRCAAVGGAALLLAGCSGSSGDDAAGAEQVTLESLMGLPSDEDFDFNATVEAIEEAVAICMANEGWNYLPRKLPTAFSPVSDSEEQEVERIKLEGLSFTSYLLNDDSSGGPHGADSAGMVDHNEKYVLTLSESERAAYDASLYGTQAEQAADTTTRVDPTTGEEIAVALGSTGCRGEARDGFYGDDPAHDPVYKEAMQAYWDDLDARTEADPRFVVLDAEWAACMDEDGFDYDSPDHFNEVIYVELQSRVDDVVDPSFYADPMEGWAQAQIDEFWSSATEEEVADLYSSSRELTSDERAQLEEIFADEVAVALAAHSCSKDFDEKAREIAADVEEQFALEHEDELRALAATLFDSE